MASEKVRFVITWEGAANARLHYILDNDRVVVTEADDAAGNGSIECDYSTTKAAVHVIEWSLWFPGKAARKLVAKATISGTTSTLDSKKEEQKNKWHGRGAAP